MSNVSRAVNIADLRLMPRRRLPKAIFDYVDGGAEDDLTLRATRRAFRDVTFRPRHAVAVPAPDLRVRVLGHDLALPVLLAPVGYNRLMRSEEHTSELQSQSNLVCRLLLEKKKKNKNNQSLSRTDKQ